MRKMLDLSFAQGPLLAEGSPSLSVQVKIRLVISRQSATGLSLAHGRSDIFV